MKQALQLGTLSAANIGITVLFQWFVLTRLGPGMETDALFAGMALPQLALAVTSGVLMHVLVPLLAGEDEDQLRHDAWGFFILVGALFGLLAGLLYVTAPWWIPITVPGFNKAARALTVELTRIQLVGMVFAAVNAVQWAAYHARRRFVWAEFTPLGASALGLLLLIWALPRYGVMAAAWISTARLGAQTLLLAPGMGRPVRPDLKSVAIQQAWRRIRPLLLGTIYFKTDPLVDRFLLSTASAGSLSLYYLAQQIYGAVTQIINRAIAAPLVPILSSFHKEGDRDGFRRAYYRTMWRLGALSLAGVLALAVAGRAALGLLIGHGHVSAGNVTQLWWIMLCLGGMFVGGTLGQVTASAFFSAGDTKTPTRIGIYTYTLYVPAKLASFHYGGVVGLALVTSVYVLVTLHFHCRRLKQYHLCGAAVERCR